MRVWFGGPRIGFIRPGISFSVGRRGSFSVGRRGNYRPAPTVSANGEYVYVIEGDHGHVKIGISSNPSARLATLQTGSSVPLSLAWFEFASDRAFEIEQEAHAMLAGQRLAGEWFNVPKEAAIGAVYGAAYRLGVTFGAAQAARRQWWRSPQRWAAILALYVVALAAMKHAQPEIFLLSIAAIAYVINS